MSLPRVSDTENEGKEEREEISDGQQVPVR